MQVQIHCNAATISGSTHPNEMTLKGVLVRLDEPSTRAPHGSEGHRIYVPLDVAKRRLKTLIGMGLNYSPNLDAHAQRRKVGVIKRAYIKGQDLCVEATVWKHDFPEAERDLKQPGLGMSMELGDVDVEDSKADVWRLKDFCFLGATVLYKKNAAYYRTEAIAAAAAMKGRDTMAKKVAASKTQSETPVIDVNAIAAAAAEAAVDALQPSLVKLAKGLAKVNARFDELDLDLMANRTTEAAQKEDEEADSEDEEASSETTANKDCKAAKKKDDEEDDDGDGDESDDEDDDEMDSTADDKGSSLGPETEESEDGDQPGEMNKGATNKGDKTTMEDKVGKTVNQAVTGAALQSSHRMVKKLKAANRNLQAQLDVLQTEVQKFRKELKASKKQIAAATVDTERRSIVASTDPMLDGLLAKSGLSAREMAASGQVLSVSEAEAVIKVFYGEGVSPMESMSLKNKLLQAGLMEQGYTQ